MKVCDRMNRKEIFNIIIDNEVMLGDDWILTEPESGIILLQRKSNKVKCKFTNLKSR